MTAHVTILEGDVFDRLRQLPAESVDCVVTSPPYWGLRDYGIEGQLGMEPTLEAHLARLVAVFREVRRVMRADGILWLNYGDTYASAPNGRSAAEVKRLSADDRTFRDKPFSTVGGVLKPKDLCMVANRLAIALQEDGWWVRSEIVWAKPNPMPDSSGRWRPGAAHEKIFMLARSARHYYDAAAVRMPARAPDAAQNLPSGWWDTGSGARGKFHREGRRAAPQSDKQRGHSRRHAGFNERWDRMTKAEQQARGRLLRNWEPDLSPILPHQVWEIATRAFRDAHFATFPPALVAPCIMAGCRPDGVVLDPFAGSGTVGLVAVALQREAILIELNPDYVAMSERRIRDAIGMLVEVEVRRTACEKTNEVAHG